jgi:hypothetical protein
LKIPKTIANARVWGKLVPIVAVISGECHDIFYDKWEKPTWTIPITSGEIPGPN